MVRILIILQIGLRNAHEKQSKGLTGRHTPHPSGAKVGLHRPASRADAPAKLRSTSADAALQGAPHLGME